MPSSRIRRPSSTHQFWPVFRVVANAEHQRSSAPYGRASPIYLKTDRRQASISIPQLQHTPSSASPSGFAATPEFPEIAEALEVLAPLRPAQDCDAEWARRIRRTAFRHCDARSRDPRRPLDADSAVRFAQEAALERVISVCLLPFQADRSGRLQRTRRAGPRVCRPRFARAAPCTLSRSSCQTPKTRNDGLFKEASDRVETIKDTVRREEAQVEKLPGGKSEPTRTSGVSSATPPRPADRGESTSSMRSGA